jgi:hypothetical protein
MSLQDNSMGQLKFKVMILESIIRDAEAKNDPRVDEPKRQLKIINDEISRRENQSERPPDLVVGLDTLSIKSKTRGG